MYEEDELEEAREEAEKAAKLRKLEEQRDKSELEKIAKWRTSSVPRLHRQADILEGKRTARKQALQPNPSISNPTNSRPAEYSLPAVEATKFTE